ncbi:carbohydrate-binding module family 13 protein [Mycena albidolilacea]|uniref:Carbohydrate-binding module family 13 protein n=1 Tax=Mycena albidolilacea TaxID=1033008 RepID=A0AAD6ZSC6_9AGAR|nr:carbohydrate-binding module family 13 protein [Mycena albidolilacea]
MFAALVTIATSVVFAVASPASSLDARAGAPIPVPIHPILNTSKCMGIVGGVYANGTQVDIFDCNDSASQNWAINGGTLPGLSSFSSTTTGTVTYCLDAGVPADYTDGVRMKIWKCFSGLAQQTWNKLESGQIQLANTNFCLDLTNGDTTNRNVLQIWTCTAGDTNQIWKIDSLQ